MLGNEDILTSMSAGTVARQTSGTIAKEPSARMRSSSPYKRVYSRAYHAAAKKYVDDCKKGGIRMDKNIASKKAKAAGQRAAASS